AMVDGVVPMDRAQIENARMSAAALSAIVRQLGELTGAEAAALQRRSERLDLAPLASEIVAAMDRLLRDRSVTAQVDGAAQAWADRGHVERALRNVVTNAVQHSPAGGAVVIALTQAASGMAQIRVSDAGPGIPARDVPHVFERFYRADPARASGSAGSGIGLTIARELLAANGGSIGVERTGPDGTVFVIHLRSGA
ncbi:MAG: sensor histidine kinase, partial [Candidatus Limnocylindria bacterium]